MVVALQRGSQGLRRALEGSCALRTQPTARLRPPAAVALGLKPGSPQVIAPSLRSDARSPHCRGSSLNAGGASRS